MEMLYVVELVEYADVSVAGRRRERRERVCAERLER